MTTTPSQATAVLCVSPTLRIVEVAEPFIAELWLDCQGYYSVDAGQVYIDFDPQILQVLSLTFEPDCSGLFESYDNTEGHIGFAGGPPPGEAVSTTARFAAIELTGVSVTTGTQLSSSMLRPRLTRFNSRIRRVPLEAIGGEVMVGVTATPTRGSSPTLTCTPTSTVK